MPATGAKMQKIAICNAAGNTAFFRRMGLSMAQRVAVIIDMQNGVFISPRFDQAGRVAQINRLTERADITIFIQHREGAMCEGNEAFNLLSELIQPAGAYYVTKTACDSFWQTELAALLKKRAVEEFVVCGCATDYCLDTTIKVGASAGYAITVAADAHTTADRHWVSAEALINQHNEVWSSLSIPGNVPRVLRTDEIVAEWS